MNLVGVHEALAAAAALRTAARFGVADRLGSAPVDVRELACECWLSERGTRGLLAVLTVLGIAEPTTAGRYRATPAAELLHAAVDLYNELAEAVRTGRPAPAGDSGAPSRTGRAP